MTKNYPLLNQKFFVLSIILLGFLFRNISLAQAPNWQWAKGTNGFYSFGQTIDSDSSGNLYVAGGFLQTLILGNDTLTCWNGMDCYITKLDPAGNTLWATKISGGSVEVIYDITVDEQHDCFYVAGQSNSAPLECHSVSAPVYTVPLTWQANVRPFLAKYDLNGNFIWIRVGQVPPQKLAPASRVKVDTQGNIILGGSFTHSVTFNNITLTMANPGSEQETFIYKFDSLGTALWGRQSNGGVLGSSQGELFDMNVDANNDIYVAARLQCADTVFFGNGVWIVHPYTCGSQPAFLAKYDSSGNALWAKVYGNVGAPGTLYFSSMEAWVDNNGTICLYIGGRAINAPYTLGNTTLNASGASVLFICKMDTAGNPIWVTPATSATASAFAVPDVLRLTTDECGDVYFAGHTGWYDMQMGALNVTLNAKLCVAKLDSTGIPQWIQTPTNAPYVTCKSNDLELDKNGELIVTGYHYGDPPLFFGTNSLYTNNQSFAFIFIAKLASTVNCSSPTYIDNMLSSNMTNVFPNPSAEIITVSNPNKQISQVELFNVLGEKIITEQINNTFSNISVRNISSGTYFVKITFDDGRIIMNKVQIIR